MWISEQFAREQASPASGFGEVSIGGARSAVLASGREQRLLPVVSPGGYAWLPQAGQQVLVLKEGGRCIAGAVQPDLTLAPGEVLLYAGTGSIRLKPDGTIRITGRVFLNDVELGGEGNGG